MIYIQEYCRRVPGAPDHAALQALAAPSQPGPRPSPASTPRRPAELILGPPVRAGPGLWSECWSPSGRAAVDRTSESLGHQ